MPLNIDRFKRINGHTLKIIACITMLIDHITAGILLPVIRKGMYPDSITFDQMKMVYNILRGIGRTSFPIFCFLLVEGFIHTKSRLRYALSLFIFGLISEIPFDITFYAKEDVFNISIPEIMAANKEHLSEHCNVYFTLLIGLMVIWCCDRIQRFIREKNLHIAFFFVMSAIPVTAGILLAEKLHTDYHGYGVFLIAVLYLLKIYEPVNIFAGYIFFLNLGTEYLALPGFILLLLYNKKRGRKLGKLKYAFYAFYPVHIIAIYFFRCILFG
ncbi:TraX family protein [Butyrivibrio sp. FCS014]|uniref:TraX family protein n=1 Tax=Butyrivibrio sp. FCS014 TaxID=1408304 RepID=UPI0004673B18|nr:TraX family protein [Butyrivibrio sp. FCS014]